MTNVINLSQRRKQATIVRVVDSARRVQPKGTLSGIEWAAKMAEAERKGLDLTKIVKLGFSWSST